ncbi:MAG: acyloxyacyl hydrolase [Candidatus Binatia bacterium]
MTRVVLSLLLIGCLARASLAEEAPEQSGWAPDSYAFRVMNGHAHGRSVESIAFGPRATFDVLGFIPELWGNRVHLGVELLGMVHDKKGLKHEINLNPLLLDWRYDTGGTFVPYVELGEGILWTTLRYISLGGKWQFASHVGLGTHVFMTPTLAISAGYRFRHISNAGLQGSGDENDLNHGLNQHFFILGLTRFPGRGEAGASP